jgi:hypothetical protein
VFGLEFYLAVAALIGLICGAWGLVLERIGSGRGNFLGRAVTVCAIVFLGGSSVIAAFHRADGLVPLGLSSGFLVVGLLWGEPKAASSTSAE